MFGTTRLRVSFLSAVGLLLSGTESRTVAQEPVSKPASQPAIKSATLVVLSTMLADGAGVGEWGFAALVEANGHRILFDTGARSQTVARNAEELGIDLSDVTEVVLSHHHGDHTGGLVTLRRELMRKNCMALSRAYVGKGIFLNRLGPDRLEANESLAVKQQFERLGGSFVEVDRPTQLSPGIWLTGPVPRTHPERNWSLRRTILKEGQPVEDNVPEDMSLLLDSVNGLIVISGCGHAGIINTLEYARKQVRPAPVYAIVGGFHLFEADNATLDWTASMLRSFELKQFLGAHCTGIEPVFILRQRLGLDRKTCAIGAVGARFNLQTGIDPGRIAR